MNRSSSRLADGLRAASLLCIAITTFPNLAAAQQQNHAVALNGVDAFGTASGVGSLVSNSTWEAWVKIPSSTSTTGYRPVLFRWGMYSHGLDVDVANGQAHVSMYSCPANCAAAESAEGALMGDTWHHLAMVYGPEPGPSCTVYVDGQQVAACGAQGCTPYAGWQTILGARGYIGYDSFLHATVDEARISNSARYSGAFVPQRRFIPDAMTVGLWHFDEGQGATAFDSSGHGRHFTLHGGYSWTSGNTATPAEFVSFGQGCLGSGGVPALRVVRLPRPGTELSVAIDNLPVGYTTGYWFLGFSNEFWSPFLLPLDLGFFGMPNCTLYVEPAGVGQLTVPPNEVRIDYLVPASPSFVGVRFYLQALLLDPMVPDPTNTLGAVMTDAMAGVVGY